MSGSLEADRVVFAVHDGTTSRNLRPIASALPSSVDVEFLLLDDLFGDSGVSAPSLSPYRQARDYVRSELFVRMNRRSRPGPLHLEALQWLIDDIISPRIPYRLDEYLDDADPSLFVCGHDRLPFVKHLTRRCRDRGVPTVVVQHGVQRMEHLPAERRLVEALRPSPEPRVPVLETVKRRLLYRYGAYIFGNPYVDRVFTMGEYFTEQIRAARSEYPCLGQGTATTIGYPEYGLADMDPYDPEVENGLFLSGWELELGEWGPETERQIADTLREIELMNGIEICVRPHPKDSPEKIERFYDGFPTSDTDNLATDIDRYDFVCTVYSTALLLAVARGKVCGVLQLPWEKNRFGPFTDQHVLQLDEETTIHERATDRSVGTQRDYLDRFCYIPSVHAEVSKTPAEYAAAKLVEMLRGEG